MITRNGMFNVRSAYHVQWEYRYGAREGKAEQVVLETTNLEEALGTAGAGQDKNLRMASNARSHTMSRCPGKQAYWANIL